MFFFKVMLSIRVAMVPCMIADRGGDEFLSVSAVIIIIIKVFLKPRFSKVYLRL